MKKTLSLLLGLLLCLFLTACGGEEKPFITLDTTDITVNADGTFELSGTAELGVQLEVGGAEPALSYGADDTFTATVQMIDPVDSATLTATYYSETLEFPLTFDTSAYVSALEAAQEQAAAEAEREAARQAEIDALQALSGTPLTEAITAIAEAGYTATYYADGVDFTEFIEDVAADYTTGELTVSPEDKTVSVEIILTSHLELAEERAALEEKLSTGAALVAVQNYGEALYPYGFDLHSFFGVIAQEMEDENTWFLKATCDVTNEYGAEAEFTCEALVTGTSDAPEVISFEIY